LNRDANLNIFLDVERLQAGDIWRDKLLENIKESQHLVVLWSNEAKQSGWVNAEIANFLAHAGKAADRKLLCLLLEGTNPAYDVTQMLAAIQRNNGYGPDPTGLTQALAQVWSAEVDRLFDVIRDNDQRLPIPFTVVAMNGAEAGQLDGTQNMGGRVRWSLNQVLARLAPLGLGTLAQLRARYGPRRLDWKPFLGAATVETLLNQLLGQINNLPSLPANVKFKWEWVDFLAADMDNAQPADMDAAQASAGKLSGDLALVVLDPLSLYHPNILLYAPFLNPCFERESLIIMTLTPFELPQMLSDLRDVVRRALAPMFDFYYAPPVPLNRRQPLCGLNLCDDTEVRRMVQFRIGHHPLVGSDQDLHPAISMGKGRI
jgi:hypothetical protein